MMYRVVNAERVVKVDASSMLEAAAQFLNIPVCQLFAITETRCAAMYGVCTTYREETDERVAVFEIKEG